MGSRQFAPESFFLVLSPVSKLGDPASWASLGEFAKFDEVGFKDLSS